MAKARNLTDDQYMAEKLALENRCVTAEVTGDQPIRDSVSRESVEFGGTVRLDPKTTNLTHLERAGAIRLLPQASQEA